MHPQGRVVSMLSKLNESLGCICVVMLLETDTNIKPHTKWPNWRACWREPRKINFEIWPEVKVKKYLKYVMLHIIWYVLTRGICWHLPHVSIANRSKVIGENVSRSHRAWRVPRCVTSVTGWRPQSRRMMTILSDTVICHSPINVICIPCTFYRSVAYSSGDIRVLVCCRTYGPPCTYVHTYIQTWPEPIFYRLLDTVFAPSALSLRLN